MRIIRPRRLNTRSTRCSKVLNIRQLSFPSCKRWSYLAFWCGLTSSPSGALSDVFIEAIDEPREFGTNVISEMSSLTGIKAMNESVFVLEVAVMFVHLSEALCTLKMIFGSVGQPPYLVSF